MINTLIVEKDFSNCKKIIAQICKYDKNIRFCEIANNEEEALNALTNQDIDVIILSQDFLKKDKTLLFQEFADYIICIDDNFCEDSYILNIIEKINKIIGKNMNLMQYNEKIIKNKIKEELQYLGYNLMYKGSKYLMESIYILYNMREYDEDNLEKDIYSVIAQKYNRTVNNIKCNIIYATNTMFHKCKEDVLIKYLKYDSIYKLGPKKIIYTVLNKLK